MAVLGWHNGGQGVKWKIYNADVSLSRSVWAWEKDREIRRKSRGREMKKYRNVYVIRKSGEYSCYLSSMRSCAKMSLPGQWMDLQMSPIISTSSHELSRSCTWSWRDSCRKPRNTHTKRTLTSIFLQKDQDDPHPVLTLFIVLSRRPEAISALWLTGSQLNSK